MFWLLQECLSGLEAHVNFRSSLFPGDVSSCELRRLVSRETGAASVGNGNECVVYQQS